MLLENTYTVLIIYGIVPIFLNFHFVNSGFSAMASFSCMNLGGARPPLDPLNLVTDEFDHAPVDGHPLQSKFPAVGQFLEQILAAEPPPSSPLILLQNVPTFGQVLGVP
jgi:hypothetical protein